MSFNEWKECKLEDFIEILSGYAFKSKDFTDTGIPVIKIKNIVPPNVDFSDVQYVSEDLYNEKIKYALNFNDILISLTGSNVNQINSAVGKVGRVRTKDDKLLLNQRVGKVYVKDENNYSNDFLYYYLIQDHVRYDLALNAGGSANQANINPQNIKDLNISLPPIEEQKAIAKILSDLDEKIEVNNKINKNLEEMAQGIFKHWFVDFEFPNEDGQPYKSSGGEMVESELGMIPKGWEVVELGCIIDIFDSKRIPLSKNKRDKMKKIYPYYGAASLMDYVDDYIFDGVYVLMGEDGTVIDEDGYPILQYVWGKFWVNNHAHVLKGKSGISDEFIYILLKKQNISASVTGAVQLKINQQNLKNIKIILPKNKELIEKFSEVIRYSFNKLRCNCDENERLIKLRDTLLPKLMSGEIRVPLDK